MKELAHNDVISARISHFGAEVLLYNHGNVYDKYNGMPMDKATYGNYEKKRL